MLLFQFEDAVHHSKEATMTGHTSTEQKQRETMLVIIWLPIPVPSIQPRTPREMQSFSHRVHLPLLNYLLVNAHTDTPRCLLGDSKARRDDNENEPHKVFLKNVH